MVNEKLNANLIEVPIHFRDRNKGKSKIPKLQIFISFFDLLSIKIKDLFKTKKFYELNDTYDFEKKCKNCEKNYFARNREKLMCLVCGEKI